MFKVLMAASVLTVASITPASAVVFGGIDFPDGLISFADRVDDFSQVVGSSGPTAPYSDSANALGAPDYVSVNTCPDAPSCTFVSLGNGGSITLEFTDNALTGSDDSGFDLHIFEIGPAVEDTFVEISKNGTDFFDIGKVLGSTSSIDIDAFGFSSADIFRFVRLTDDVNENFANERTAGADIDAVGAITTTPFTPPTTVSEPGTLGLLGLGLFGLAGIARRRKN